MISEDDPFVNRELYECTIKDIRYDKYKRPYVKYEFKDGSWDTRRFDRFIEHYEKVNIIF